MTEVLFLDGPLQGKVQDVPYGTFYWTALEPPDPSVMFAESVDKADTGVLNVRRHTYTLKPNPYPFGPKQVGAIGRRVGERIETMITVIPELANDARYLDMIDRRARDQAEHTCSDEPGNIVPGHFRRVFKGTRADAARIVHRQHYDQTDPLVLSAATKVLHAQDMPWDEGLTFFCYTAIGEVCA